MATPSNSTAPSPTVPDLSASCTTAVPGKYGNVPIDACNSYYNFNPQYAPALAVTVLFGVLTTVHIAEAIIFKKRYCWVVIMGAAWETIGFALHAVGAHNQQNIGYATAHNILFLLAPLWVNAFVYTTFSRVVYFFLPEQSVRGIKAASLAKYFVWADIVSFIIQGVGGIMASPGASPDIIKTGINVYMGGIGLQESFILFFVFLMISFHRRALQIEQSGTSMRQRDWRQLQYTLYGVLMAITVRIVYRICEYAKGVNPSNPVPFHEAYSYALDAFPMMLAILALAVVHPGRVLSGPESEFPHLSRKEKKAVKQAKKDEKKASKEEKKMRHQQRSRVYSANAVTEERDSEHQELYPMGDLASSRV